MLVLFVKIITGIFRKHIKLFNDIEIMVFKKGMSKSLTPFTKELLTK